MVDTTSHRATPVLALALDFGHLDEAAALAGRLAPYFSVVKVGLELFCAAGVKAVQHFRDAGFEVFLDVKLHDIPTTVGRTAIVLGRLGPRCVTLHTAGGAAMLRAGVDGLNEGAYEAGFAGPMGIGVTVLTSEADPSSELIESRVALAVESGCGGLVCAAPDLPLVRQSSENLLLVVPGTRPAGASANDQLRVDTPEQAVADGAAMLVIGRVVTAAPDPVAAAQALCDSLGVAVLT